MNKRAVLSAALCGVLLASTAALACGDKLLHMQKNVRRQQAFETIPASVLVFARPNSLLANTSSIHLESALREEGHKVAVATRESELADALRYGTFDVIMVDVADVAVARNAAASVRPQPMIVPVVAKQNKQEWQAAAHDFVAVVKVPAKADKYVDAVERAMEAKSNRDKSQIAAVK